MLALEIAEGHKLVCISGQSGYGKTTLCRRVLGDTRIAWLSGGQLHRAEEFWRRLCDHLATAFPAAMGGLDKSLLLKRFRRAGFTLVIDDFHLVPAAARREWSAFLKPEIYEGMCPILIGIPRQVFTTDYCAAEMSQRIAHIQIPSWTVADLMRIGEIGFGAADLAVEPRTIEALAHRADGSPLLMQRLCHRLHEALESSDL